MRQYCLKNKEILNICQSNYFWREKIQRDFPGVGFNRNDSRQEYIRIWNENYDKIYNIINDIISDGPDLRYLIHEVLRDYFDPRFNLKDLLIKIGSDPRLNINPFILEMSSRNL